MKNEAKRPMRKVRQGKVVRDTLDKTTAVAVVRKFRHHLYPKVVKKTVKFLVHDEKSEARAGDFVEIMETRRLSKTKHWRLVRVIKPASGTEPPPAG